ncbi:hypothetical protein PS943_02825 [Pseudomonas fluorescens]|uniref:Transmembrane protein n=2 Tax=Pseudomonas fluorescens TaxID=294 RepID=A0A5E7WBR8_PSEFL|nr:hypothetical protein PS943_02825 [Pseudomonas fluorescens]
MGSSIRRILIPLAYLRIRRDDKFLEEVTIPLALTALTMATIFLAGSRFSIYGIPGLINSIISYLQLLSGFYITALAAIATFNREGMDDPMLGDPPTLDTPSLQEPEKLSRRRFLCFLFGYLAFGSLLLYIGGTIITLAAPIIRSEVSESVRILLRWGIATVYIFCTFNILVTSMLGMYYLTDRLHRITPTNVETAIDHDDPKDDI